MKKFNSKFNRLRNLLVIPILLSISLTFALLSSCEKETETVITEETFMPVEDMKSSDPVIYFGPETFTRETGQPNAVVVPITNPNFSSFDDQFIIYVQNGDGFVNLVSGAIIKIDGIEIFGPSQFNQQVAFLSEQITGLTADSELEVTVYGAPGGYIEVWIDGYLLWQCGDPIVDARDGKSYNTTQIGDQCWMAENLNYETENSWCYDDDPENCETYGRLYNWITVMNGEASSNAVPSGVQGICPDGWHVPGDEEWKILEGTVDSQYGVGDPEWDGYDFRGFDVGKHLKTVSGWDRNTGTDAYGFSALPGGYRNYNGDFIYIVLITYFWSSTEFDNYDAWYRYLYYNGDEVTRYMLGKQNGFSLRCVKD